MDSCNSDYVYALKCIYKAHSSDVRAVQATLIPENGIITCSRDTFAKVWAPEGESFRQCNIFKGGDKYVTSVCVLPPSDQYPKGLFLVGSHDSSIYAFTPESHEPCLRLLGHSNTVCALSYGQSGFFMSGSWDKTARLWSGQMCIEILEGHQEAVWAVELFPTQNLTLTGSADCTIRMWRGGVCEKIFTGHKDCVRGLAIVTEERFLSCSNDRTIRLWSTNGQCQRVFSEHSDYIYSIALLKNKYDFVTCGEDQNLKIYRNCEYWQTFVLPCKSLWSVTCLSNGDLAVGGSDGKVYVFERKQSDYFVMNHEEDMQDKGDYQEKNEDSSAHLVLGNSIKANEDVIIMYQNDDFMYVCQYDKSTGVKVKREILDFQFIQDTFGDKKTETTSSSNGSPESSSEKKDFSVDVQFENKNYKLAFNRKENPYEVAATFLNNHHDVPYFHKDEIVDFVIATTGSFEFTNDIYPAKNYLTYIKVNLEGLRKKLLEFSEKVPKEKFLTPSEVDELMLLAHFPYIVPDEQKCNLEKVITWNDEFLFPVLDLLRLGVQSEGLRATISSTDEASAAFMNHLLQILMHTKESVNQVLVVKILCNMFGCQETEKMIADYQLKIFDIVKENFCTGKQKIQKAASALFLNFAIACHNKFPLIGESYCLALREMFNHLVDSDAIYRMLLAVGTLCAASVKAVNYFREINFKEFILKFKDVDNPRVQNAVELLYKDL